MIQSERHAPPVWIRWVVVALWMGVIFYMSAQSNSGEQSGAIARLVLQTLHINATPEQAMEVHHLLRKCAHFTEYGVLAALMAWAQPGLPIDRAAITWGAATLYAATDEWHQTFVPNRRPAITDVLTDSAGALLMDETRERVLAFKNELGCEVGFHNHNNLGLGVANSLIAFECGADRIDASLAGMGAGAGNCALEALVARR